MSCGLGCIACWAPEAWRRRFAGDSSTVPVAGHRGNGESTYLGTYVARMRKGRLPQCLVARLRDPCGYLRPRREAQLANDVLDVPFRRR